MSYDKTTANDMVQQHFLKADNSAKRFYTLQAHNASSYYLRECIYHCPDIQPHTHTLGVVLCPSHNLIVEIQNDKLMLSFNYLGSHITTHRPDKPRGTFHPLLYYGSLLPGRVAALEIRNERYLLVCLESRW